MNIYLLPSDCKTKTDRTPLSNLLMKNKALRAVIRKQANDNEQAYYLSHSNYPSI